VKPIRCPPGEVRSRLYLIGCQSIQATRLDHQCAVMSGIVRRRGRYRGHWIGVRRGRGRRGSSSVDDTCVCAQAQAQPCAHGGRRVVEADSARRRTDGRTQRRLTRPTPVPIRTAATSCMLPAGQPEVATHRPHMNPGRCFQKKN
jgi:hypothetical protein